MEKPNRATPEHQLAHAVQQIEYFKRLAKEAGDVRLRETEALSKVIAERKQIEKALLRRDRILKAVAHAAEQFLGRPIVWGVIPEALERLGKAAEISRVYIFENHADECSVLLTSQRYEWAQPGIPPQIGNPKLQNLSYRKNGFGRWEDVLGTADIIHGDIAQLPESEREMLAAQGIRSILIVPIFVESAWWGFIGFDDCRSPRRWPDGEIDALRAAARTLGAAIKQMQDREKIGAANRAKSEFLANMSHEVRTPLNHIMGFIQLVVDGQFGELNPQQREYLQDSLSSSHHLLTLINDILDLSKVEAGGMVLQLEEVDLAELMKKSITVIREKAAAQGQKVIIALNDVPKTGRVDERKFKQILYNLLSNAVKFSKTGGMIRMTAARVSGDEASIRGVTLPEGFAGLHISVHDSGIGLAATDLQRIFNPFEQVEQSYSRRFQGTGLGLSLTKSLVELHGGRIWAASDGLDKGASFHLILPV